ncbi:MAG: hypothetical protein K8H88_19170 [Sandaracinaceae bacterium]|nr:hypothetical protein [Sandaracinaceae bacterium]
MHLPRIAASLLNGVRQTMIDEGHWADVERVLFELDPHAPSWLKAAERGEWVLAEHHLCVIEAMRRVLGAQALERYGAAHLRRDMETGALAPVLRSWARSFARDPHELLRVIPHAWQAVTRNLGRLVRVTEEPGRALYRLEGDPGLVAGSPGWQSFLTGFATELLHLAGRGGRAMVEVKDGVLEVDARWPEA